MNTPTRVLALLVLTAVCAAPAHSQNYDQARADVNLVFAIPQGDFDENLDEMPVGVSAFIGGRVPNSPLVLGTELAFLTYDSAEQLQLFQYEGDFPVEVVHFGQSNNVAMGHLVARLQPATGAVQPFVDVLAGLRYFNTRTRVDSDIIIFRNGLSGSATNGDWALSAGVGGGVDFNLFTGEMGFEGREGSVALSLGARYLFGAEAEYATEFRQVNGGVTYDLRQTRTDLIQPQIGLRVKL